MDLPDYRLSYTFPTSNIMILITLCPTPKFSCYMFSSKRHQWNDLHGGEVRKEGKGDQALDNKEVCGVVNLWKTVGHRDWFAKSLLNVYPSSFAMGLLSAIFAPQKVLSSCPHNWSWFSFVYPTFCQVVHTICLDFHLFIPLFVKLSTQFVLI